MFFDQNQGKVGAPTNGSQGHLSLVSNAIPERFTHQIHTHLLGNLLNIVDYPLIMWIVGKPGMGKTWQLRTHLELLGFKIFSVGAADLESEKAGEPAKLLQRRYIEAGVELSKGRLATVVVDDIDTTVGEWELHTGTVNHEGILAFLMHIADSPTLIESVGAVKRVPVFFTGNDASRLYGPLVRHGRTAKFHWQPNREEKIMIIASILGASDDQINTVEKLVDKYPDEPIAFYSQMVVERAIGAVSKSASAATFSALMDGSGAHAAVLRQSIESAQAEADWLAAAEELFDGGTSDA